MLSFVLLDGRFMLVGYEVDLLFFDVDGKLFMGNLKLLVSLEMKMGLGLMGLDFEVRV